MDNMQQELRQAEQNFNYAEDEFIDTAIYELKAVDEKINAMVRGGKSMDNIIIIGESERYCGCIFGKYKIDLDIIAETDDIAQVRDEIETMIHKENICKTTFAILKSILEELENYEDVE